MAAYTAFEQPSPLHQHGVAVCQGDGVVSLPLQGVVGGIGTGFRGAHHDVCTGR